MISESGQRLLDYLPPYYGGDDPDPFVARWLEALAFELDRLRHVIERIRDTSIPGKATDEFGALSRWERALGRPVAPAGVTEAQRNAAITGYMRGRIVVYGKDWTAAMTAAIGSDAWAAHEHQPGPYQLTIEIPYIAGSYSAGQVEQLARGRTPANLQIIMRYQQGFIVGVSRVGDAI